MERETCHIQIPVGIAFIDRFDDRPGIGRVPERRAAGTRQESDVPAVGAGDTESGQGGVLDGDGLDGRDLAGFVNGRRGYLTGDGDFEPRRPMPGRSAEGRESRLPVERSSPEFFRLFR